MSEKLVLIDGHSILNRAFFGLPDLTNAEGLHTNAVYGFLNILFKILEEEQPDYLTVAFDVHAPTFRHKMFDGYKGTRKPMAEELRQQVPLMKEMLTAMGVAIVEKEGYEADDIIGTIAGMGERAGMEVSVVSGDRDLLQLATDHVQIRIPKTKKTGTEIENYYAADVKERYQVTPKEFIDVKALMGDTSDNIPGVPGIGEKTASALIAQYGSIESVHEHAAEVKPPRAGKNIVEFWEQALMSKTLAAIETQAPVEFDFSKAKLAQISDLYTEEAYILCRRLDFKNLLGRFDLEHTPGKQEELSYQVVQTKQEAESVFAKAAGKRAAFHMVLNEGAAGRSPHTEADGQLSLFGVSPQNAFCGLALVYGEEELFFLKTTKDLTSDAIVEMILTSETVLWISTKLKQDLKYLNITGEKQIAERNRYFDIGVAAYLLNPLSGSYPYDDIAKNYLNQMVPSKEDYLGKKPPEEVFAVEPKAVMDWACQEASVAWRAAEVLEEKLKEQQMDALFHEIEMPLVFVLSDMEQEGILMDAGALEEYGKNLAVSIEKLEQKIHQAAGEEFNINSPKQLGAVLFEKMGLPNGKKTKTGYSTSAEVLEKLAPEHPIVADILEYRQLTKLKSTYADGLINFLDPDGRIRTTFNQTITATGRLSSTDPNLQNIPIRIELGKMIRKVFYPKKGYLFVDSDYSQIELRVLAHLSEDEQLIKAYQQNEDIHRITASQVFHVPFEEVTPLQRRNAKAVNFGIVYGISSFGLSQDLSISKKEAAEYMERYFETYPGIKVFLNKTVEEAKEKGFIRTMFGRIRPIPELSSSNFMQRSFGERVAMNSPIQGTAADIIKIAMIRVHDRLIKEKLNSRLILQVHDELLVETAEEEKEQVAAILKEEMQGAADLSVSLEIDTEFGYNWYEAH